MIALFIAAAEVAVMLVIVMQKHCLTTFRTSGVFGISLLFRCIWCKLMAAFFTAIFLITEFIFAVALKRVFVVAFRALDVI